jgi:hypothetical protein
MAPFHDLTSVLPRILGEYDAVARQAKRYGSVRAWRRSQAVQAATLLGAAATPPLPVALPACVAASAFAVRKLAHVAWGVGELLGARVEPMPDFAAITESWLGKPRRAAVRYGPAAGAAVAFVARLDRGSVGGLAVREDLPRLLQAAADRVLEADPDTWVPLAATGIAAGTAFVAVRSFGAQAHEFYVDRLAH